jgi:hypothetical protein
MQHRREKLLKGEPLFYQTSQRQGCDALLLQQDVHAVLLGIQLEDDATTHELGGKVSLV